ncbi:MAG: tetratricopeptide repeat protein [Armatimonadetes bacterium]|nr:tetratricopeptide repeat protein [Armatimonadota bacterium]
MPLTVTCPNCAKENPPDARFCMRCGTALTRACPTCGATNSLQAQFCLRCGSPLERTALPERRIVSVLFADLAGSTILSRRIDPEPMREMIGRYFDAMREEIERYGGTVEKFIGDAVMAVFGLPVAHEDDPLRAARAALAMQRRMHEFNRHQPETLHLRIAITTGEVVADPLWAASGQFMVTGETVNFAARLQAQAPTDAVVIDERTLEAVGETVDTAPLAPVVTGEFAGRPRWRITGLAERPAAKRLRARMVGRDEELQFLLALYRRVVDGRRPYVATIIGPAGVGKTRLAEEFLHALRHAPHPPQVMRGRCPAYGEGLTYWPLAEMLKQECEIKDSDPASVVAQKFRERIMAVCAPALGEHQAEAVAADLATLLGVELPRDYETMWRSRLQTLKYLAETRPAAALREPGGSSEQRHANEIVLQALRSFLTAKAQQASLVLLIEDLHWAEDSLLELIERLPAKTFEVPVLILCLARPDLLERRPTWGTRLRDYTAISLEPLSAAAGERLIGGLVTDSALPDDVRRTVLTRADGNPFFMEEILRMLIDEGNLVQDDGGWRWVSHPGEIRIPDTIQALLLSRLDLLTPLEKRVIQDAAVAGRVFWPGAIEAMAGLTQAEATTGIERLQDKDLIEERPASTLAGERELVFTHALIREVAYTTLPKLVRSENHRRFARWLEQIAPHSDEFLEVLAFHREQAWRSRHETGDAAPELAGEAVAALRQAAARAIALGTLSKARRLYERALVAVRNGGLTSDAPLYAELLIDHSEVVKWMRSPAAVFEDTDLVLQIAPQIGREDLVARAWLSRAHAESDKGRLQPSEDALRTALELFRRRGDRQGEVEALELLGIITHSLRGRLSKAQDAYREVLDLYRTTGDPRGTARTMALLSRALLDNGDLRQARPLAEEALRLADTHNERIAQSLSLYAMGILEHMAGTSAEALRRFEQAIAIRQELGDVLGESGTRRQLGMHLLRQGRIDDAEREFQASQALLRDLGETTNPFLLRNLAELYLARGDLVTASEYGEQAVAGLSEEDDIAQGTHRATLGKIRAAQGRAAETEELFAASMDVLKETEYRIDYALALLKYGEALLLLRQRDRAVKILAQAREQFATMGATNFVKEIDLKLQTAERIE